MRIGDLAKRAGTTTRALRFYESEGLLPVARGRNGYRDYDEEHLRLVREIQSLRAVGFSLDETRPFVECLLAGHSTGDECPDSIEGYERKLAEVDACLERLSTARERIVRKLVDALERQPSGCTVAHSAVPTTEEQ